MALEDEDEVRVTVAEALLEVSAADTAATVTVELVLVTVAGAVYRPDVDTVPVVAAPPVTPFTDQVMFVFELFVTVALNWKVWLAPTVAVVGVMVTVVSVELPPPHPIMNCIANHTATPSSTRFIKIRLLGTNPTQNLEPAEQITILNEGYPTPATAHIGLKARIASQLNTICRNATRLSTDKP